MWRITLADRPDAECPHCHEEIAHGDTIAYDEDPVGDELVWHSRVSDAGRGRPDGGEGGRMMRDFLVSGLAIVPMVVALYLLLFWIGGEFSR